MATHPGKAPTTARVIPLGTRDQRGQQNLHGTVPHRAALAHSWSVWSDESVCDGRGQMIAVDEAGVHAGRPRSTPLRPAPARRWYVCTRHADGRILCGEQLDLEAAVSVLTTFLDTARRMGYQVHPQDAPASPGTRYLARQGTACVMFWIGATAEGPR